MQTLKLQKAKKSYTLKSNDTQVLKNHSNSKSVSYGYGYCKATRCDCGGFEQNKSDKSDRSCDNCGHDFSQHK
jgi:hypothetical protein